METRSEPWCRATTVLSSPWPSACNARAASQIGLRLDLTITELLNSTLNRPGVVVGFKTTSIVSGAVLDGVGIFNSGAIMFMAGYRTF
jgi:hypothetical protein